MAGRPPLPPFTLESAIAEGSSGRRRLELPRPERVSRSPTREDSRWRNRAEFMQGRAAIVAFLRRKWVAELDYRLIKELWAFGETGSRCALPTSGTMTTATGSAATAMRTGSSTSTA